MKEARLVIVVLMVCLAIGALIALTHSTGQRETYPKNKCIDNLRLIDGAKQTWALEHKKSVFEIPTWIDIEPYLGRSSTDYVVLKCPSGGTYTLGSVSNRPTCSIPDHVLP